MVKANVQVYPFMSSRHFAPASAFLPVKYPTVLMLAVCKTKIIVHCVAVIGSQPLPPHAFRLLP
jgi:hypothetical protein